ncbi:TD and POZ domain-containing protein 2 [Araneus ventricosus]|uniref:TD and POZ domain-containing protein 2 n=1 Tax=Araneus ventricosus TaxID=182803 RepID=A0A4Y2TDR6_ARAVE|nr:TD and POZ domain-containing protein 2 [Araneus ventricosus]
MSREQIVKEVVTQVTAEEERIKWTIQEVSQLLENSTFAGPEIYYEKICMGHISFGKVSNNILIKLHNKSNKTIRMIKSKVVLLDCDGKKLREEENEFHTLQRKQNVSLMIKNQRGVLNSLKDDKLIIDCCLKFVRKVDMKSLRLPDDAEYQKENGKKVLKDLMKMYNNPDGSDFTFQVGNDFIYAHKTVLSFRSEYFRRMLATQMKEGIHNSVLITDVSYSTMKNLVEWIYTGSFNNRNEDDNFKEICNLYMAADKYQIMDLKSMCADQLRSSATVDNLIEILKLAARHNDDDLKNDALTFISFDLAAIVKSNTWKTLQSSDVDLANEILNFHFKNI